MTMADAAIDTPAAATVVTPTIAIIGMEGAGKTVLTTTLAKRLSAIDSRGIFLNPQGVKTLRYVERVWQTLQSGEWPPSTPPGELFELNWKLQVVGEIDCHVRLIDAAGQDLRLLFGDEQIHTIEALPAHLRRLADCCRHAHIVLFLVNLKDFIGEANPEQRAANEAAIKSAMDYLAKCAEPRRLCLVLTQSDLYRGLAAKRGGWLELVAAALPYVFGAHVRAHQISVFPVSAVADTQVTVDAGKPRRIPVPGFRSEGLDELIEWLAGQLKELKAELSRVTPAVAIAQVEQTPQSSANKAPEPSSPWTEWVWGAVLMAAIAFGIKSCGKKSADSPAAAPTVPVPVHVVNNYSEDPGRGIFPDDGLDVFGTVRNDGASGYLTVIAEVLEHGQIVETQFSRFHLLAGHSINYKFDMDRISSLKNPYSIQVRIVRD